MGRKSSPGDLQIPHTVRYMPAGQRTPPVTPRRQRLRSASEGTALALDCMNTKSRIMAARLRCYPEAGCNVARFTSDYLALYHCLISPATWAMQATSVWWTPLSTYEISRCKSSPGGSAQLLPHSILGVHRSLCRDRHGCSAFFHRGRAGRFWQRSNGGRWHGRPAASAARKPGRRRGADAARVAAANWQPLPHARPRQPRPRVMNSQDLLIAYSCTC